jgi:hypothetical protein
MLAFLVGVSDRRVPLWVRERARAAAAFRAADIRENEDAMRGQVG